MAELRILHGLAGTVGALALREAVGRIQGQVRAGGEGFGEALAEVEAALVSALGAIERQLQDRPAGDPAHLLPQPPATVPRAAGEPPGPST